MNIHFIAIGGAAMHNLAIALHKKGYRVTGSDDEIFDPSRSRLQTHGLLPKAFGWFPEQINSSIDVIILGMHARKDNPELIRAQELNLKVYSYPEYLYEQCKEKKRVVIGGSHGKTTITSMVMHVLKELGHKFDYMVGAQIEGFDTMVQLSHDAPIAIFEGDEYLSSPIDLRPKFHWYKPHVALLTGVAWDHINVFPTWENYVEQFTLFADTLASDATLIWYLMDPELQKIADHLRPDIKSLAYDELPCALTNGKSTVTFNGNNYTLSVFGPHNLQNLNGARLLCAELGIADDTFFKCISSFKGAAKRLQTLRSEESAAVFLDFAHSPSKLEATVKAVKQQYPHRKLVACMELHTFSSLNKDFLPHYKNSMQEADMAYVYFNPKVVAHKKLPPINEEMVRVAFGTDNVTVFSDTDKLQQTLHSLNWENSNLLLMSSGNFSGIDFKEFAKGLF
ncbi:UDP-N-acetylmuramate: L-alanyl-gamma-D-glutamyl-meso-diaminopimelate ligase [Saccharicrinis carchari]|uniref:UDP-N-acetylmuramate: L-alanyl-gamma-D-glutamyl-meso-diaminopimelate ligase n=1 Tax=Saccharicrinis carchari TaxID=1168039 RepID=A0A521CNP3_SACCC|nr:Mur ligase family protein [Saccharicrinis carchari]SMO61073.1 UDP-N-acetylmuramate: L-alanyl-gamma-D-glutamyl-meso-diaminopimelate ligase [Saccharicrinis carchari]